MWPLSRYQDFTDNTVPAITAAFLHAVQDALSKVYLGTQSLKAMVIDGTGGSTTSPTSPAIGTTLPQTAPIRGEVARDAAPAGMGCISGGFIDNAGAGLLAGYGIHELHRTGAGDYYVVFVRPPSTASADKSVVQVSSDDAVTMSKSLDGSDRLKVTITLAGGVDLPFDITAWIF